MTRTVAARSSAVSIRRFTDCVDVAWTVYCITPPSLLDGAMILLPHRERRQGWLLFESEEGEKRRLTPFPPDWATVSEFELERWCMRATPDALTPRRRREDVRR